MSFKPPTLPAICNALVRPRTKTSVVRPGFACTMAPALFAATIASLRGRLRKPVNDRCLPARPRTRPSRGSWRGVRERRHQLARGLVALAANAQAAVNDLLQVITAGQRADIAAANRAGDVTTQEHYGNQPDLVDVVALLPASHPPPCDLVWYVEQVERIGGDAATAELVCRDPKVAELELLVFAHEHVERCEVSVERLSPMQRIEHRQDPGNLAANQALGLRPLALEPGAEIAVLRIFHDQAVPRACSVDDDKSIEDAQRARLAVEELREVRLAQPRREAISDLDANLRW